MDILVIIAWWLFTVSAICIGTLSARIIFTLIGNIIANIEFNKRYAEQNKK